jgi:hypothetical protein
MDEKATILSLVSYKFLPPAMGGQKGIAYFNRYLSRHTNLICVTIKDNNSKEQEGYPVKNILSNHKLRYINPFYYFTLSRIIREEKITHLIIEHPYYGWLGILLKSFCKVKLIVHSHNIESLRFKSMGGTTATVRSIRTWSKARRRVAWRSPSRPPAIHPIGWR